ncbi:metal-sensitive transcriptional regulator [Bauldia sp.]|uniref:metal-sensitive transcriptional regulator n=1 Tax=Bauldia sp. TaxID=2575872 RepID=UPI003BAC3CF7
MQEDTKNSVRKRLNRVEGQVRGIARMVEADRYCIDVVTQIAAVRAALRRIEAEVIRDHAAHCVADAVRSGDPDERQRKVDELITVLERSDR